MAHIHAKIDFVAAAMLVYGSLPENAKVLFAYPPKIGLWIPPGGHVELDEQPDQTIERKLHEKAGLLPLDYDLYSNGPERQQIGDTRLLKVPFWMDFHPVLSKPGHNHISLVYVGQSWKEDVQCFVEHSELRWFSGSEIYKRSVEGVCLWGVTDLPRLLLCFLNYSSFSTWNHLVYMGLNWLLGGSLLTKMA